MIEQGMLTGSSASRIDERRLSLIRAALENQPWWIPKTTSKQLVTSVTFIIIVAQICVFAAALVSSGGFVQPSLNTTFGPSRCALIAFGAKFSPFVVHKAEYWRLVSASFVHSGLITLFVTILFEVFIVLPVELENGRLVTLFLFFMCGVSGYTFSCLASPIAVDTGALACVMGFVGFRLAHMFLDWPAVMRDRRKTGALEALAAFITLILGQSNFVDNYSSFAGCIVGFFLGGVILAKKVEDNDICFQKSVMALASVTTLFVLFVCAISLGLGSSIPLIDQYMWGAVCQSPAPRFWPFNVDQQQAQIVPSTL